MVSNKNLQINGAGDEIDTTNTGGVRSLEQNHTHEFLGSTKLAGLEAGTHNHRFMGITSEEIKNGYSHIHEILIPTDFLSHHHQVIVKTDPAIYVGARKHVHLAKGTTTHVEGHAHDFVFATLIQQPMLIKILFE